MSSIHVESVLAQIRALSSQVHAGAKPAGATPAEAAASPFAAMMKGGIEQVNQSQKTASDMATAFERGVPGVELPQVMLEMQKAQVSLRALTEVRNRFVNVYQDIMNMPI
ncbi:MAG: flagellar hook-basal body complex protein FliE [Candidatus Obscuribacterales bacterium]|nr:flagellar hook-basal body complex protein FliE [Steroidobacteraceae bacterium]